jgi:hypothetical protein
VNVALLVFVGPEIPEAGDQVYELTGIVEVITMVTDGFPLHVMLGVLLLNE